MITYSGKIKYLEDELKKANDEIAQLRESIRLLKAERDRHSVEELWNDHI